MFALSLSSGWHLDHVDVWDDATGKRYFFPCQRWFDKNEEDGLIERVLEVWAYKHYYLLQTSLSVRRPLQLLKRSS